MESVFRRILGEVLEAVTETQDIDSLLGSVSETLLSLPWIDRVITFLFEPDSHLFEVRSALQKPDIRAKLPPVGDNAPYKEDDIARLISGEAQHLQFPERKLENEIFPEVVFPLTSCASHFGLMSLSRRGPDKFTSQECDFLIDLGRVISLAVENRLLLSREWRIMPEDALTGLCTRLHFEARVSEEIERADRYGGVFSILIAGIDNHEDPPAGGRRKRDSECGEVLKAVAPLLKQGLRDVDTAARCSEGELAVLLPHTDEEGSLRVANRLICALREVKFDAEPAEKISFSIGAATYPDDSAFRDGLLEAADIALCCARAGGGDRVMCCREARAR